MGEEEEKKTEKERTGKNLVHNNMYSAMSHNNNKETILWGVVKEKRIVLQIPT